MSTFKQVRPDMVDFQVRNYLRSTCQSEFRREEGLLVIPVMGPEGTAPVTVRVHAPIGYRVSEFEYAKKRSPPVFPAQADTASGDKILTSDLVFPAPTADNVGILRYGVRGRYTFVQGTVRGTESKYQYDGHPFLNGVDVLGQLPITVVRNIKDPLLNIWNAAFASAPSLCSYNLLG